MSTCTHNIKKSRATIKHLRRHTQIGRYLCWSWSRRRGRRRRRSRPRRWWSPSGAPRRWGPRRRRMWKRSPWRSRRERRWQDPSDESERGARWSVRFDPAPQRDGRGDCRLASVARLRLPRKKERNVVEFWASVPFMGSAQNLGLVDR
jgi:hypothetical protein